MFSIANLGNKLLEFIGERNDFGVDVNSRSQESVKQFLEHNNISSLFNYRSYDDLNKLFYNEKSVGFAFEIPPMVGCTKAMQTELSEIFKGILPDNSNLQFLLFSDYRIDGFLDKWVADNSVGGELYAEVSKKSSDFFKNKIFSNKEHTIRDFRCVVSYSQEGVNLNAFEREQLFALREKLVTVFNSLGLPVHQMNATDMLRFLDGIINFSNDSKPSKKEWNRYDDLNIQVADRGNSIRVDKDGVFVDDSNNIIKSYGVKNSPNYWSLHAMNELVGSNDGKKCLSCPFLIHYGIYMPSQDQTKLRVEARQDWVESQARSKVGKKIPIIREQSKELEEVSQETSRGEKYVRTGFNVFLLSPVNEINRHEHILKSLFISNGWELVPDKFIHLQILLSSLPMMWGEGFSKDLHYHDKLKTTLSTESANLLPIQAESKGNSKEGLLLLSRKGQVQCFDPFINQGNANMIVVGKSGAGKSVFMQALLRSLLARGGRAFVIDVGRSFEKQIQFYGGSYIIFKKGSNVCINPFTYLVIEDEEDLDDVVVMFRSIVELMVAPKNGTNEYEDQLIEESIKHAWDSKGNDACINDAIEYLNLHKDSVANKLGKQMGKYAIGGAYSRYFNGRANVNFKSRFVVVELSDLDQKKDLQAVIFQMMALEITNQVYLGDRKQKSHLIIDEAWDALSSKRGGVFIERAARRLRKYKGSLVVGTQGADDFFKTPAAKAAYDNSDWSCFLTQTPASIDRLRQDKKMEIDDYKEQLLKSIKLSKGNYSEIFIQNSTHGYFVSRLLCDPYSSVLYSTDADEFTLVNDYVKKGMSIGDAVGKVARDKYGA